MSGTQNQRSRRGLQGVRSAHPACGNPYYRRLCVSLYAVTSCSDPTRKAAANSSAFDNRVTGCISLTTQQTPQAISRTPAERVTLSYDATTMTPACLKLPWPPETCTPYRTATAQPATTAENRQNQWCSAPV
jgi:hypothetical protein